MKVGLHLATRAVLLISVFMVCVIPASAFCADKHTEEFGTYPGYGGPSYGGLTTESLYITMRDGVKLAIDINLPEGQLRALHRRISDDPPPYHMPEPYHSFKRKDGAILVPGEIAEISFGLHPISALIRKGHRLRVAIAGADKDSFVRISADGVPVITLERNRLHASYIDLPVIE